MRNLFLLGLVISFGASAGTVRINFLGVQNNQGSVRMTAFRGADGFPSDVSKAAYVMTTKIDGQNVAYVDIENMVPGSYAIAAFHDENDNAVLDTGIFGIPKEAYGFSNDARHTFGPPKFEEAAFEISDLSGNIDIHLK